MGAPGKGLTLDGEALDGEALGGEDGSLCVESILHGLGWAVAADDDIVVLLGTLFCGCGEIGGSGGWTSFSSSGCIPRASGGHAGIARLIEVGAAIG